VSPELRTQRDQATTLNVIGLSLMDTGQPYEAEAKYDAALAILRELAEDPSPLPDSAACWLRST
jgi:hypothetical protein